MIAALVTEPLPNPAVGLIGLSLTALLSRYVLFAPADLAKPGFKLTSQTINWALSGFSSTTVWLVGGAFMFALGYQKSGLGRRIALLLVRALGRSTLLVGYATTLADAVLAPFTPSNTARSAGIIFPIVNNLPSLYGSKPNDPSARRFGGYIMWTTFAAGCVTSSLFMTACAPNFLAIEFIGKIVHVRHHLPAMDEGLAAVRAAAAAGAAAAGLCAVSARGEAQHRGDCLGARRASQDGRDLARARSSWRCWSPAPSCSG